MCWCMPQNRTPCCGKPECRAPSNVVSLDDHRPHVVIETDKAAHVVPATLIEKWAKGEETPPPDILGRIVTEWMEFVATL